MIERYNKIAIKREAGQVPIGMVVQLGSPDIVEMAGIAGFDYVWIDCEHGSFDIETSTQMLRAADAVGITPLIRIPNHDRSTIMRALDAGAMGVIVPNVETRAQAEKIVAAAKYRSGGNGGTRGACPGTRASWHQAESWQDFVDWSNRNTTVWLIVESPLGVQNLEEIISVPGVNAIVIGSFDLAQAMDLDGDINQPDVQVAVNQLLESAKRHNIDIVANMFSKSKDTLAANGRDAVHSGATILCVGSDRRMFMHAMKTRTQALMELQLNSATRSTLAAS